MEKNKFYLGSNSGIESLPSEEELLDIELSDFVLGRREGRDESNDNSSTEVATLDTSRSYSIL